MAGKAKQPVTPELLEAAKKAELAALNKTRTCGMKKGQFTKRTQEALTLVVEKGMDPKTALMLATGNMNPSGDTMTRFREKVAAWSLRNPKNLKIASETLIKFAGGKDVNGIVPKASDVKAAAERIVDASDPVIKRTESVNVNIDFSPVDLAKYKRA